MSILGNNASDILTIKEPVIEVQEIKESYDGKTGSEPADDKLIGYANPFVKINGYRLTYNNIVKFKLSTTGFRPTLNMLFIDPDDMFDADFPKDGDLIEVYLRSPNDSKFKKIRIDFDIIDIKSTQQKSGTSYNIRGIMRVPDLLSDLTLSFQSGTSYNHLLDVCDSLQLGFASNVTDTVDEMPRFNAKNTIQDFIKKTTETSYTDDNSFYTSYIDLWYYLNFVEVNRCFITEGPLQDGDYDGATFSNQDKGNDGDEGVQEKFMLSNHKNWQTSTSFIQSYSLFNNSGDIWMKNGYKRFADFYNMDVGEFQSFFVDPLTTEGAETDNVILKGRAGDNSYENQIKYKYFGRMFSTQNEGNLHPNYHYAKIQNYQNNTEINKMGLVVALNGISSSILKYKSIPVAIFKQGQQAKNRRFAGDELKGEQQESNDAYTDLSGYLLDSFLSGWYVVKDYDIVWESNGSFSQIVYLIRREWPLPYPGGNINQST